MGKITKHDIDNFSLYSLSELKTIYGEGFNLISEGVAKYMDEKDREAASENYIKRIVSEAIGRIAEESDDEGDDDIESGNGVDESGIGTYYTLTFYNNGERCWCEAFKSLSNARKKLKSDFEYVKKKVHHGYSRKVEWVEADEEFEDEVYYTAGGKRKTRPKKMVNDGFVEHTLDGVQHYEVIGEEQGNISELEASDRFSG